VEEEIHQGRIEIIEDEESRNFTAELVREKAKVLKQRVEDNLDYLLKTNAIVPSDYQRKI
jgi:hypothetical protein